jgi:hypothetical protein
MTQQEFIEKYGNVYVRFDSYYKYSFTFKGVTADGTAVYVEVGGNPDAVYSLEVDVDAVETVSGLDPYAGRVYKDGVEVDSFDEY